MFVLKKSHKYFWPVKAELPKDGGKFEQVSFEAEFKQLPQSEIKKILNGGEDNKIVTDDEFCKKFVVGWRNVQDQDGNTIDFSDEALVEILEVPSLSRCIVTSYLESLAGSKIKKLVGAAELWARGSEKKTNAVDDLAVFGASIENLNELKEDENTQYEIFEENWATVEMFHLLTSQWNYSQGACIGLNYQSVEFFFKVHKVKNRKEILEGLQVMEFAALKILHAKDK